MFETGMSALVLKICSEYAKSLGLNFPPCTQQEINAICEWVDKHTIKDMTISQNGFDVTFTFKTENDVTKDFTFTIPKAIDIGELEKVLVGSESVVVNRTGDNSKLQVRLSQSVTTQINGKLDKPATPTAESAVTMLADGTVGTKPLSEIGGTLYKHNLELTFSGGSVFYTIINSFKGNINSSNLKKFIDGQYSVCVIESSNGKGVVYGVITNSGGNNFRISVTGVVIDSSNNLTALDTSYAITNIGDSYKEL